MKKLIFIGLFFALAGGLVLTGCKKEKEKEPKPTTQSVADNDQAQSEFDDLFTTTDDVMDKNQLRLSSAPVDTTVWDTSWCAWVTINSTTTPKTITINFGDTVCLGYDGRQRKGKILITYTAPLRIPGAQVTITLDSFYVDSHKLEGAKSITNTTTILDTLKYHIVVAADTAGNGYAELTLPDGVTVIKWKSDRTRKHILVPGLWVWNDEFHIDGSADGFNRNGTPFTVTITKTLIRKMVCLFTLPITDRTIIPVSGTIEITPGSLSTRVVDFGTGTCDKDFTVTVDNITFNCTAGQGCQ